MIKANKAREITEANIASSIRFELRILEQRINSAAKASRSQIKLDSLFPENAKKLEKLGYNVGKLGDKYVISW